MNHDSDEFRVSGGNYDPDDVSPFLCQSLCKEGNFSYAAVLPITGIQKYCLCSPSNADYPEIDSQCCKEPSPDCDSDPDVMLAFVVNDDDYIHLSLAVTISKDSDGVSANYDVKVESTVAATMSLYLDNELISEPEATTVPDFQKSHQMKGLHMPGKHVFKAVAVDSDTGTLFSSDESVIYHPDDIPQYDVTCPPVVMRLEEFLCNVTILRGSDMVLAAEFEGSENEEIAIPDAGLITFGPNIPRYFDQSSGIDPPGNAYLGLGRLPFGKIAGFEFFATAKGKFIIEVLKPRCDAGFEYCGSCQSSCESVPVLSCTGDSVLCSLTSSCSAEESSCSEFRMSSYQLSASTTVEVDQRGYAFRALGEDESLEVEPGFVISIKASGPKVLAARETIADEAAEGKVDTDETGQRLDMKLLIKFLVVSPLRLSLTHNFSEAGQFKLTTKVSSEHSDEAVIKQVPITVASYVSGLFLSGTNQCVAVGSKSTLTASLDSGSDVTIVWSVDADEWKKYPLESLGDVLTEDYECTESGNATILVEARNVYGSVNESWTLCCMHLITRKWSIQTDSPKIVPPGEITVSIQFTGEDSLLPENALSDWDFGDGSTELHYPLGADSIEKVHGFEESGKFNVSVTIYNTFDAEKFTVEVELLQKLGELSVQLFYKMAENSDLSEPHGQEKIDIPKNSYAVFMCNISGAVEKYEFSIERSGFEESNSDGQFSVPLNELGEYEAVCQASNVLETSNLVALTFRVLGETAGLTLEASKSEITPHEEVEFTLKFESSDDYTCYTFDAGDGDAKQAFGNEDTCRYFLAEDEIRFNGRDSERKRRETQKAEWLDEKTINIVYSYHFGGKFQPKAEAFNSIYRTEASAEVAVAFPASNIWIENNSTNIRFPMKFLRSRTFRLETTAILTDHPSLSYNMSWEASEVSKAGKFIRRIDVTGIVSARCSAIRFPERFLDVGLYMVTYYIEIYDNETFLETLSCFTYLEITRTELRPMIIRGGASYILRGYGQVVDLEPALYSEDPDDPEEKKFDVEWNCRCFDPRQFLDGQEYNSTSSLSLEAITWTKTRETQTTQNCFKDSKTLSGPRVSFNTEELVGFETLYEIDATISKDSRVSHSRILLDVIEKLPPSIIVRCEKRAACTPTGDGFLVNPSSRLSVRAECISDCDPESMRYTWLIYAVVEETSEKIVLDKWSDHAIVDDDRLGVFKSFFETFNEHLAFHIEVTGVDSTMNRPRAVAKLYIRINEPPKPGSCEISSTNGIAMISLFKMDFAGWTDPENRGLTDFSIYINNEGITYRIHYGVKTSMEFILPPGEMEVMCAVEDFDGGKTTLSVGMVSTDMPDDDAREEWKASVNMKFIAVQGKIPLMAQAVSAESMVDKREREENYESVSDEVGKILRWYQEQDGIDTSYFTKEAWEEIEAEVRDRRAGEKDDLADKNLEMFQTVEILPFEVLADSEVYGQAISALAQSRPLNQESKSLLDEFIVKMFESSKNTEVAHVEEKVVSNMLLANSMNSLSKTLSDEMIGGNFLASELEEAYDFLSFNLTQPNFFLLFVEGSRWQVEEKVHQAKVEGVKNLTEAEVEGQVNNMRNITDRMTDEMIRDVMVGEPPLVVNTSTGLQIRTEKKYVEELSGVTFSGEGSSVKLPSACALMNESSDCEPTGSMGMVSVTWSSVLEVKGTDSMDLSPESSTLDFTLTNREGNESLAFKDSAEPFEICLSMSPPSEENRKKGRYVLPKFSGRDDFLVYHRLVLDKGGAAVKVDFTPGEPADVYVLFFAVGHKPSLLVYDGVKFLQESDGVGGIYSVLFGLSDFNPTIGDEFYLAVGRLANKSSLRVAYNARGHNLTREDMTNDFPSGYSIALYTTGCYYFSKELEKWSSDGCKVHSVVDSMICCHCNHLTMFGGGLLVAPNTIDFEYVFANADFNDNLVIYTTLIVSFSLYIILAIWARWKDRKDLQKLGASPLLDNDVQDKYFYEIIVQTGFQLNAGTKSKVHFILSGEEDETDVRTFADDQRPILQRGDINAFVMAVPRCLGQLNYLRIWHDNSGEGKDASWYLKYVVVKDILTGYKYEFVAERWLAVEEGDGLIDHLIPVAGKEQTTEFSHLFPNASRRNLADNHLWLSVFTRPARSRFTRVQRLSCCLAVLYLSMLTSAMWYERTPEQPSPGAFKFGPLSISPEQIAVGIVSNLIVFPPTFIMIFFFRKSRARSLRPSHVNVALDKQHARWRKNYGTPDRATGRQKQINKSTDEEGMLIRRKKKLSFPWWCVFFSWFLVVASVGCSMFFIWAYGLQFGNERTMKWLTSLLVSFLSSVLLTEPIKIICLAVVIACLCGNPDIDEDDADDDEEDPYLRKDEEWLHNLDASISIPRPKYRPIDPGALEAARKVREKEVRMYKVLREIGAYALYLWILMVLSYGNRDPNSFYIREAVINNIIKPGDLWVDFNNVNTEKRFWNWTREALIPELFASKWYNGRVPLGLRLMLDDRNNFKVGYPVLRQVRAAKDSCKVPWLMQDHIEECAGYGNLIHEDGHIYRKSWKSNITMSSRIPQEYKYLTATQLNGFPFWGQLDWYGGGGYVVPLVAKRYEDGQKLIKLMTQLEQASWIDKDTRAVFVEFGTYNAQINLFVVGTIVAEFVPGGGIVPYYHIDPIKLLHYHTGAGLIMLCCQIGFLLFTIYYTVCELVASCTQGKEYLKQYWNIAELLNLIAAYSIIGVEIYKMIITRQILDKFTATQGTGYIKLQEALIVDEGFCYLIGFLMSLATLKFIKLLRFNKRIGSMLGTLKLCAHELGGYAVCLLITFVGFVSFFWLILGRGVKEFSSFLYAFESSISMMLKKFNYEDIAATSPVMGPVAFFTFALTASVILVNILLTIIIQSFEEVKHDVDLQNSDYELLPFIMARLKLFLGITKRSRVIPIALVKKQEKRNDVVDAFTGKVDRLLEFINSVYLDEGVDISFLNKAGIVNHTPATATEEKANNKKSRLKQIPRYQSQHVKKHLDF